MFFGEAKPTTTTTTSPRAVHARSRGVPTTNVSKSNTQQQVLHPLQPHLLLQPPPQQQTAHPTGPHHHHTAPLPTTKHSPRPHAISKELSQLLRNWDKGNAATRRHILTHFIAEHRSETASEIEASYANGCSLLLSRLISSMRILQGGRGTRSCSLADVVLHFKAMQVFLSSSSGAPYLSEYLEAGGIVVTLNALGSIISPSNPTLPRAKYLSAVASDMCQSAFELLRLVAVAGRPFKEILCECGALIQVASLMRGSMNSAVNHDGRTLLLELGSGNPAFQDEVLYTILQMLPCPNPVCQRMAAQITRALMSALSLHGSQGGSLRRRGGSNEATEATEAALSFVPAAVGMTQSVDLQVQYEAVQLLSVLSRDCPATIPAIVAGLLPLARNPVLTKELVLAATPQEKKGGKESGTKGTQQQTKVKQVRQPQAHEEEVPINDYKQIFAAAKLWQASAARALEVLVSVDAVGRTLVNHGGVYILLSALLNVDNVDARDVALEVLILLCKSEETTSSMAAADRSKHNSHETVGSITRLAVANVLTTPLWNRLRVLTTTVGYTIDDLDGCNRRIAEYTSYSLDATSVELTSIHVQSIVQNLYACRMISKRVASTAVKRNNGARLARGKQRRALSVHIGPETVIERDNNEYRELMERLIRSSLPEIMDRDFSNSAQEAFDKRHKR